MHVTGLAEVDGGWRALRIGNGKGSAGSLLSTDTAGQSSASACFRADTQSFSAVRSSASISSRAGCWSVWSMAQRTPAARC